MRRLIRTGFVAALLHAPAFGIGLVALSLDTASAAEVPTCAGFAWSVERERAAFAAPDLATIAAGAALPADAEAAQLILKPAAEVALPIPSEKTAKPDTFAGFVTAAVPAGGTYQVTLSNGAWIDVSQDGRSILKPSAHSGKEGCPEVRKSVRFVLDAGSITIEISRASRASIKLGLLKAE